MASNLKLLILYGSETGNAEDLAKRIGWQAIKRSFVVNIKPCDDYKVAQLVSETFVLFICSTTGQGEEPFNMKLFWRFLRRKDLPSNSLSGINMAVIGLGDSSYHKYNYIGKKLYKRLSVLGANMVMELVLGDDQHEYGPDATILPWLNQFWLKVDSIFPSENENENPEALNRNNDEDTLIPSSFNVILIEDDVPCLSSDENRSHTNKYTLENPFLSHLISNERVTAQDHFQDVRLIKMHISDDLSLKYEPGDVCLVHPENSKENVDEFLSLIKLDGNQRLILENVTNNDEIICDKAYAQLVSKGSCTINRLVTQLLDIQSVPKKSFFELLWRFSQDDIERGKLKEFASPSGQDDLYEYCNRPKRNILEVLTDFPHTTPHIPLRYLFDLIPAIKPRSFSIASDHETNPNELHLLVAVVHYETRLKKPRLGLCSNYLANLVSHDSIRISIRKSDFKLPKSRSVPLIMIGPGTGVAPFRSFIQHRAFHGIKDNYLFFGCRNIKGDFYLKDEWEAMEKKGYLYYYVACSRDESGSKFYVQNLLWQERKKVYDLIYRDKAWIYIAGNAKQMPNQVKNMIVDILEEEGGEIMSDGKAKLMVEELEAIGKLLYDCWA